MNQQEQQKLKALFVALGVYYGQEITDGTLRFFIEDLDDLEYHEIENALRELRRDPRTNRLPLPAIIRDRIKPTQNNIDTGRDFAARIISAISLFGWSNATGAREYIGEDGWMIVRMQGGWNNICEMVNASNITALQAQWRDLAVSLQKAPNPENKIRSYAGIENKESKSVINLDVMKRMPE